MNPTPTTARQFRVAFLDLLLKKLQEYSLGTSLDDLTFTPQEQSVAEYYCKELSRETVSKHLSSKECAGCLRRRITRLVNPEHGNHLTEWDAVEEFVNKCKREFSPDDVVKFHNFQALFKKVAASV